MIELSKRQVLQEIREEDYRSRHPGTAELDLRICRLSRRGKTAVQIAMEIPCSESTVYRALRRVQGFISAQNYDRFLQELRKTIDKDPPDFDSDTQSVLEMLYAAYAEKNEHGQEKHNAEFLVLNRLLSELPMATTDPIIAEICVLCNSYERGGFIEGFKLGVHMANELTS